jgi:hypothetical protein
MYFVGGGDTEKNDPEGTGDEAEWNKVIRLIPFDNDGDGYLAQGLEVFERAVFGMKPEERVGYAIRVAKRLYDMQEYRKAVKLCDFISMRLIDTRPGSGALDENSAFYKVRIRALGSLEDSLLREADRSIVESDAASLESVCEQITYTRHKKLWAYNEQLNANEELGARLGRAKTYVDLGRLDDARRDIQIAKAIHGQKSVSIKV